MNQTPTSPGLISFPTNFLWGAASGACQIEGSALADGGVCGNWLEWAWRTDAPSFEIASNHYESMESDVALMKELGLQSYRFSISWPRIIPARGAINKKGLSFYRRLIDALNEARIVPHATLFHYEMPAWARGGWENRETAVAFNEYSQVVFHELGNSVPLWSTQSDAGIVAQRGYLWGTFPPGKQDRVAFAKAVHHLNLAHGLAVDSYRQMGLDGQIGSATVVALCKPAHDGRYAAQDARNIQSLLVESCLDPLAGKGYPSFLFDFSGERSAYYEKDLRLIHQPVDFLGVNHCPRHYAHFSPGLNILDNDFTVPTGVPVSDLGGPVVPDDLHSLLLHLARHYPYKSLFITKNGLPMRDSQRSSREAIEDDLRIHYLGHHLVQIKRALDDGVPLRGYYVWSLMDQVEWSQGQEPRFGLIHVDFETLQRTFKKSAAWYRSLIAQNGFNLDPLTQAPPYRLSS